MEAVSESEWQEMKGIAIMAQNAGYERVKADPQDIIDLIDQRSALLEALREVTAYCDEMDINWACLIAARAAIKKATGE